MRRSLNLAVDGGWLAAGLRWIQLKVLHLSSGLLAGSDPVRFSAPQATSAVASRDDLYRRPNGLCMVLGPLIHVCRWQRVF